MQHFFFENRNGAALVDKGFLYQFCNVSVTNRLVGENFVKYRVFIFYKHQFQEQGTSLASA